MEVIGVDQKTVNHYLGSEKDDSTLHNMSITTTTSSSSQICSTQHLETSIKDYAIFTKNHNDDVITNSFELLDATIEDLINKKESLALTMDLVYTLMREVECKEKVAEQAKQEAAKTSLDILAKVNELKQTRQQAKETNDMYAREMYGQKVALAMDLKDLQNRVSGVLNEGGKSLAVLDQMCKELKERLTIALIEKEFADREKLEKKSYAGEALAYEVSKMGKVVEESGRLTKEATKISKMQESLINNWQMVDKLRGVISDQCEHVNLMKELLHHSEMKGGHFKALRYVSEDAELKADIKKAHGVADVRHKILCGGERSVGFVVFCNFILIFSLLLWRSINVS